MQSNIYTEVRWMQRMRLCRARLPGRPWGYPGMIVHAVPAVAANAATDDAVADRIQLTIIHHPWTSQGACTVQPHVLLRSLNECVRRGWSEYVARGWAVSPVTKNSPSV